MTRRRRTDLATLALLLVLFFIPLATAEAGILTGTIVGKSGIRKTYVRVAIAGPKEMILYTNDKGVFVADLLPGSYNFLVSERNNQMAIHLKISAAPLSYTFQLKW